MLKTNDRGAQHHQQEASTLVEQDPAVCVLAVAVGGEVGAADGVYDGLEPTLVRDEVVLLAEVGVGGRRLRVLQARHARRLRELVVVDEVVQRHVHRRRRPVRLAGMRSCTQFAMQQRGEIN